MRQFSCLLPERQIYTCNALFGHNFCFRQQLYIVPMHLIWLCMSPVTPLRLLFDRKESLQPQAGKGLLFTLCDNN
jgi:hypothetical protein